MRIILSTLCLVASLACLSAAQVVDRTDPFRQFEVRGGGSGSSLSGSLGAPSLADSIPIKLPVAVPMKTPLKLRPAKPTLVLDAEATSDGELKAVDVERSQVVRELARARDRHPATAARLLRRLEKLRLKRMNRVRVIAKPVVTETDDRKASGPEGAESEARPVLPLPTPPGQ